MDLRKIKKLIELLEESKLTEMEITQGEESIRLSRASAAVQPAQVVHAPPPAPAAAAPETVDTPANEESASAGHTVKSPMVGTFYQSPNPDSPPFVQVGSKVEVGETLCVIEAMKIFNQVESDKAGTISRILKSNGDPVEFGETLFVID